MRLNVLSYLSHIVLSLAVLAWSTVVTGQQVTGKSPSKPTDATKSTDKYQLLDQARRLATEAQGLEPKEEEIRLLISLSDVVWSNDQSLGTRLLTRSFDLVVTSLQAREAFPTTDARILLRELRSVASKYDPQLEKKFAAALESNPTAGITNNSPADPTTLSSLLLSQSGTELPKDSQKAAQLFRQSVSMRVLPAHCFFLMSQRRHAPDVTDAFFSEAVSALAKRPLVEPNEILVLSSYLFSPDGSISYLAISGYNAANSAGNASGVPKNKALARDYLSLILTKLVPGETTPPAVVYFALKNLIPQYQVFAPDLLNDVYARLGGLAPNIVKEDQFAFDSAYQDLSGSQADSISSWEKRIEKASNIEGDERRDLEFYTIVLGYLVPKKEFTRAAQIVTRISNQEVRSRLGDYVLFTSLQKPDENNETLPSQVDLDKIKNPLLKSILLSSVAARAIKNKAIGDALRVLDQAKTLSEYIDNDQDRLQAKLLIVQLQIRLDTSSGFESAAKTFKDINKFSDFNIKRGTFLFRISIFGSTNELSIPSPIAASLMSTIGTMSHANSLETFQTCRLLEDKKTRLWSTFEAIRTGFRDAQKPSSPEVRKSAAQ